MATIKSTHCFQSADGRRYAEVVFSPQVPNPAQEEDVVVVFSVRTCDIPSLQNDPYAAFFESATRVKTRTPYVLSREQREAIENRAIEVAGEDDNLGWE